MCHFLLQLLLFLSWLFINSFYILLQTKRLQSIPCCRQRDDSLSCCTQRESILYLVADKETSIHLLLQTKRRFTILLHTKRIHSISCCKSLCLQQQEVSLSATRYRMNSLLIWNSLCIYCFEITYRYFWWLDMTAGYRSRLLEITRDYSSIRTYVYLNEYTYLYIYIYTYEYICAYIYICIYIHMSIYVHIYTYKWVDMCIYTNIYSIDI